MEKVTGRSARVYRKQRKGAGMKPSLFGALVIGVISLALCVEVEARPSSRRACSDEIIRGGNSEKALITCPSWVGIGFPAAIRAQGRKPVNSEVRQQIEAVNMKFNEAQNKHDAVASAAFARRTRFRRFSGPTNDV